MIKWQTSYCWARPFSGLDSKIFLNDGLSTYYQGWDIKTEKNWLYLYFEDVLMLVLTFAVGVGGVALVQKIMPSE